MTRISLAATAAYLPERWMLWQGNEEMPAAVLDELDHLLVRVLQP